MKVLLLLLALFACKKQQEYTFPKVANAVDCSRPFLVKITAASARDYYYCNKVSQTTGFNCRDSDSTYAVESQDSTHEIVDYILWGQATVSIKVIDGCKK